MNITGVQAGYPLMSGYPHRDEQPRRKPRRRRSGPGQTDGVEISEAAQELARDMEHPTGRPGA
jgi:hypothetical protein